MVPPVIVAFGSVKFVVVSTAVFVVGALAIGGGGSLGPLMVDVAAVEEPS